jgi:signal transduction histidine kinase
VDVGHRIVWWDRLMTRWLNGGRAWLQGWLRNWLGGRLRRDLALASASFVGGLAVLASYRQILPVPPTPPLYFVGTLLACCAAVGLRRLSPTGSLALGTVAFGADLLLGGSLSTALVFTQVLYDACVYGPGRMWRWLLWAVSALTPICAVIGIVVFGTWRGAALGLPVVLIGVLPVLTGISVRQYRDQAAAERARAEQTARLAELDRQQAISAERTRMARELHDVVANHFSAVAIHATAALSVSGMDRAAVDEALRVIRENSVQGLAEMRQMIVLLRDGDGAPERTRSRLAEVDRLVAHARAAGLAVRLELNGAARELPASIDLAAYRILQESLTNALKHGAGTADVAVGYLDERVTVTVQNPLPAAGTVAPLAGAGSGLIGMRERVGLVRGRFEVGPHGQRWRVHAELPIAGAA